MAELLVADSADKLLRSYWNKMDRLMFGKAAERQNMRVPRWCFAHEGGDTENYHIHFALQAPIPDVDHMCCTLNAVWAQHHAQTAPLAKNWIMPVTDRAAVAILPHTGILALGLRHILRRCVLG